MVKVAFFILLLFIALNARENPFFPSDGEEDLKITSNKDRSVPPLKRATISFPDQARIIQKVTVEYKNLDGSLQSKTIKLQNSIDWHLPLFISQNYAESSNNKNLNKEVLKKKKFKVITKDKIIRNFLLVEPHRIVLDFKRDTNLESYIKENKNNIFQTIRVGNHAGYYRAVIELDGLYKYSMKKISNGYMLLLK